MATVNELIKMLKKDGWFIHRHGGNHDLYRHETKEGQLTVPRHGSKEIATGTYNSIMKKAGLK